MNGKSQQRAVRRRCRPFCRPGETADFRRKSSGPVLLSAYNGSQFQLDLADMGSLDRSNFELAMTIIRGRFETGHEPHSLITHGSSVFDELWDTWLALHVTERGKASCPDCEGRGSLWLNLNDEKDNRTKPCPRCAGKGRVCQCAF